MISRHKSEDQQSWRIRFHVFCLLLCFMAPLFSSLSFSAADTSLPACCRIHGRHQCALRTASGGESSPNDAGRQIVQVSERCPFPPALVTIHPCHSSEKLRTASYVFRAKAEKFLPAMQERAHPHAQVSSNQKRGPPVSQA